MEEEDEVGSRGDETIGISSKFNCTEAQKVVRTLWLLHKVFLHHQFVIHVSEHAAVCYSVTQTNNLVTYTAEDLAH